MWVAKSSKTGVYLSPKFSSIYDCQSYIDNNLKILEYMYRRIISLENYVKEDIYLNSLTNEDDYGITFLSKLFGGAISKFVKDNNKEFKKKMKRLNLENLTDSALLESALDNIAKEDFLKGNVIRCWSIDQKRWCDGFDF